MDDAQQVIAARLWGQPLGDVGHIAKLVVEALRDDGFLIVPKGGRETIVSKVQVSKHYPAMYGTKGLAEHLVGGLAHEIGREIARKAPELATLIERPGDFDRTNFSMEVTIVRPNGS